VEQEPDASADNQLSVPQLARESTTHWDGDRLKDWLVIEATLDATAETLARVTEGSA